MTDNRTIETATDRLRTLLDEHGVKHFDGTEQTLWGYEPTGEDTGIYRFAANEIRDGFLQFSMFRITPEQAIAATLGSEREQALEKMVRDMWRTLSAMYQLNLGIDIGKEHDYEQRIAALGIEVINE